MKRNRKTTSDRERALAGVASVYSGSVGEIADSIKGQIGHLLKLAGEGDKLAALEMFQIACLGTEWLNDLARCEPDLFIPIATRKTSWPVMWGSHPEVIEQNKAFAKELRLGSETGISFSQQGKTFSLRRPANPIAMYLLRLAQALRRARTQDWDITDRSLLCSMGRFEGHHSLSYERKQLQDLEGWRQGIAKELPALSKSTLKEWRPAIRELFRIVYGERFDDHSHLQKLKDAVMNHAKDDFGNQGPGIVREAMLRKVLQALQSIAPLD